MSIAKWRHSFNWSFRCFCYRRKFHLTSEDIATQVSIEFKVEKMIGFCSHQGVLNDQGNTISELLPNDINITIKKFKKNRDDISSIVRFLKGAIKACKNSVNRIHLISYHKNRALLQELFSRDGIEIQIVMESAEKMRQANINDIGGIVELIRLLEKKGNFSS